MDNGRVAADVYTPKTLLKEQIRKLDPDFRYYKSIFNLTSDLIAVTDGDIILDANRSFIDFFSQIGIDVLNASFTLSGVFAKIDKYGYVYDGYRGERWYEAVFQKKKDYYRVGISEGEQLHEFNISVQKLPPCEEVFVITMTDITRMMGYRSALEANLRTSVEGRVEAQYTAQQYDQAINAATLVSKSDLNGTLTYVNDAFCKALKYEREELIGQNVEIFCIPDEDGVCFKSVWKEILEGKIWRGVLRNSDKEGKEHHFDATIVPIRNQKGEMVEFLSIRHEITEMVRAKEEAIKTLESKTRFFDQASHELRTPLNAILNFTDQALENFDRIVDDPEERELVRLYLQRAYKNSEHLLALINSLLDLAKLKAHKQTFALGQYDMVELVREAFENCSSLSKNDDVKYSFNTNVSSAWIECDSLKFKQIVTNLISNAFKFTKSGSIEVRVRKGDGACTVEVEDTGIGIPAGKLSSVFEPFEQARVYDSGTGLGLSIVREYALAMGFELDVKSIEGEKTCFMLRTEKFRSGEGIEWVI